MNGFNLDFWILLKQLWMQNFIQTVYLKWAKIFIKPFYFSSFRWILFSNFLQWFVCMIWAKELKSFECKELYDSSEFEEAHTHSQKKREKSHQKVEMNERLTISRIFDAKHMLFSFSFFANGKLWRFYITFFFIFQNESEKKNHFVKLLLFIIIWITCICFTVFSSVVAEGIGFISYCFSLLHFYRL